MILTKLSPIELVERFIPSVQVEAVPAFQSVEVTEDPYETVAIQTQLNAGKDEGGAWRVELRVQCWPGEDVVVPYRYKIHLAGIYKVRDGVAVPAEEERKLVSCNAPAVLFSWARDVIRTFTCMGPFGPIELPLCFFAYKEDAPIPALVEGTKANEASDPLPPA